MNQRWSQVFLQIFGNFLKQKSIFKLFKITQVSEKMIENSKNYNKILEKSQKVRYKENDVDEFFQNLKNNKKYF